MQTFAINDVAYGHTLDSQQNSKGQVHVINDMTDIEIWSSFYFVITGMRA
jgi:hypothetical protein